MIDYKNGKIYQVVCNITGETYVGSTARSLEDRLIEHEKPSNRCCSKQIIERGDYYIELLETYPCESEFELNRKEGEYQKTIECINKVIAGRTEAEWREDNKEEHKIKRKKYAAIHSERNALKSRNYYKDNKERVLERDKQYRIKNAEKIKAHKIQKITCDCGSTITHDHITRHKRSKKHIDLMNKLTLPSNYLSVEEKVLVC